MAGITLEHAEAQLEIWLAANTAVAGGQEYELDTGNGSRRRLRRADAGEIREQISFWDKKCKELSEDGSASPRLFYGARE